MRAAPRSAEARAGLCASHLRPSSTPSSPASATRPARRCAAAPRATASLPGTAIPSRMQDLPRLGHRLRRRLASLPRRRRPLASTARLIDHRRQQLRLRSRAAALPGRRLVLHPGPLRRSRQRRLRFGRVLHSLLRPWRRLRRPGHLQDHRCRTGPMRRRLRVLLGCLHPGRLRRRLRPRGVFLREKTSGRRSEFNAKAQRRKDARTEKRKTPFCVFFCPLRLCAFAPLR